MELLRAAKAGDPSRVYGVLERYREQILGRIRWMLGAQARQAAESSDFLHDVYVKVVEGLDKFEPRDERAFLRWVTAIARNRIRASANAQRVKAFGAFATATVHDITPNEGPPGPGTQVALEESMHLMLEALEALPAEHRCVIELRNFEGLPFRDIGARTGRSENAAQLLHTRALVRLGASIRALSGED